MMANLILPAWMIDALKEVPVDQRIPAQVPMPEYAPPSEPEPSRDWEE
jgi:hypothetical protein